MASFKSAAPASAAPAADVIGSELSLEDVAMLKFARLSCLLGVVCAVGGLSAGLPALAQGSDGFTVIGHSDRPNEHSLTAAISYRDLDLTTRGGRAALQTRVWRTAEKLCARVGELHIGGASMASSCEDQALFSAAQQERDAIARAAAPAYAGTMAAQPYVLTMSVAGIR
jgi:UrcA family protein